MRLPSERYIRWMARRHTYVQTYLDADDLAQEARLQLLRRPTATVPLVMIDAQRRAGGTGAARFHHVPLDAVTAPTVTDELPDPYAYRALHRALAQLPERELFVVERVDLHGRTLRQAGRALGISESRASQLRTAALARLRHLLGATS